MLTIISDWNTKVANKEESNIVRKFGEGMQNEAREGFR